MASMTIQIPDDVMPDVVEALAERGGYVDEDTHGPKGAFAKGQVVDFIKTVTRHWSAKEAAKPVAEDAYAQIDASLEGVV